MLLRVLLTRGALWVSNATEIIFKPKELLLLRIALPPTSQQGWGEGSYKENV